MDAVEALTENGIPVSVISTLHSGNLHSLEALYEGLRRKGIFAWQLQACSPMGNASEEDFSVSIDFMDVIRFVEAHMFHSDFAIGIADNIGYYTDKEGYLRGDLSGNACFLGCRAGLSAIGIDSAGNVRGCESMYEDCFREGNLREKSLEEIWNAPDAFAYNRQFTMDKLSGGCSACRYGKLCAGGCRSYNYFTNGKLYESPGCAYKNLPLYKSGK